MARPAKREPEEWEKEILEAAKALFLSKGYQETSVSDIMERVGGAKGMFYRFFQSKEELMCLLSEQMFLQSNPFDAVRERKDLTGLEKIRELLLMNPVDPRQNALNLQAMEILKDPQILASAVAANRRVLTPLWLELLEEGKQDGSIRTEYTKELSQLLPLLDFWLLPPVYPATAEEIRHKFRFIIEVLAHMGLPLLDERTTPLAEEFLKAILESEGDEE